MSTDTVWLYTRQNDKTLQPLEREGRVINHRKFVELHFGDVAPVFLDSYDWFTKEAAKRIPKPDDVQAPIWCAISPRACAPPIENTVVYVLEVPREQVIYFDDKKWDYVLNRIYLPKDEADAKAYRQHLAALGVSTGYEFFEGRYRGQYPQEVARIKESWLRVFEIDHWGIGNVCGNLWEIRREWVREIIRPGEEEKMDPFVKQEGELPFHHPSQARP